MQERLSKLIGDNINRITIETFHALGNKLMKESKYNYFHNKIKVWQQKQFINNIVVKTRRVGKSDLYKLNTENPAIKQLIKLDWNLIKGSEEILAV